MARSLYNVVFVLGPPGSGKGTACKRIEQQFGFVHLSAGDLLREERQREGSEVGRLIEEHIKNGSIVPVEITCRLLENAMEAVREAPGFLIDGFPRNEDNLQGWTKQMNEKTKVAFVLFLSCSVDVSITRCLGRGQGRADDNEESLRKRTVTYNTQTFPIIEHFQKLGLVKEVSAEPSADEVFAEISGIFEGEGFHGASGDC